MHTAAKNWNLSSGDSDCPVLCGDMYQEKEYPRTSCPCDRTARYKDIHWTNATHYLKVSLWQALKWVYWAITDVPSPMLLPLLSPSASLQSFIFMVKDKSERMSVVDRQKTHQHHLKVLLTWQMIDMWRFHGFKASVSLCLHQPHQILSVPIQHSAFLLCVTVLSIHVRPRCRVPPPHWDSCRLSSSCQARKTDRISTCTAYGSLGWWRSRGRGKYVKKERQKGRGGSVLLWVEKKLFVNTTMYYIVFPENGLWRIYAIMFLHCECVCELYELEKEREILQKMKTVSACKCEQYFGLGLRGF